MALALKAQAQKNVQASKAVQEKVETSVKSQQPETEKTQEASVLNFDQSKSFSRFLEASCDCC